MSRMIHKLWRPCFDGRILTFLAIPIYFGVLFFCERTAITNVLEHFGLAQSTASYLDLRSISAGVECAADGIDPLIANPCDPLKRTLNYPRVWMFLWDRVLGLTAADVDRAGAALGLLFLISALSLLPRLGIWQGLSVLLALCSPVVVFALERANTDLFLFCLLVMSLNVLNWQPAASVAAGYGLLFGAIVLKLYPALGALVALREPPKKMMFYVGALGGLSIAYFALTFGDIQLNLRASPKPDGFAYSSQHIGDILTLVLGSRGIAIPGLRVFVWLALTGGALAISFWGGVRLIGRVSMADDIGAKALDGLRLGTALFCGTFILSYSFSYRLIMLFLCLPAFFFWQQAKAKISKRIGQAGLILVLISFWDSQLPLVARFSWFVAKLPELLIHWAVFIFLLTLFWITLPKWLSNRVPYLRDAALANRQQKDQ